MNKNKFQVIVTCQGQPFYYPCKSLVGALIQYAMQYLRKNKYHTMNFSLKQIFE